MQLLNPLNSDLQEKLAKLKNIPLELQALKQWIVWKYEDVGSEKPTKVPYHIQGYHASVKDPNTWCTFKEVVECLSYGKFDGIGFVFTDNDPYAVIDLDDTKGDWLSLERQQKIYKEFDSYSEISPGGQGLHIIIKGKIPQGRKRSYIEIYSSSRYFTFTGDVYNDKSIEDKQELLNSLWVQMGASIPQTMMFTGDKNEKYTDTEIVEQASNATNGTKFITLHSGEWQSIYNSQSEADFAYIDIIAFYTQNRNQISRVFRSSKLGQRDKAKRNDYVEWMINRSFDKMLPPIDLDGLKIDIEKFKAHSLTVKPVPHKNSDTGSNPVAPTTKAGLGFKATHLKNESDPSVTLDCPNPATPTKHIDIPPGLLGEIAQFIYAASPRPVPEIALAGAIGLMAGMCGRAYNVSSTGLNQYVLLLARCHAKGTKILMYDGTLKNVEDILPLDQIMGPDSLPRNVLKVGRGREPMVKIKPTKGDEFIVNINHILSLKTTGGYNGYKKGEINNYVLYNYLTYSNKFKHCNKLWRTGVEFKEKILPLDPWFLGALLGDGQLGPRISLTSMDDCIRDKATKIVREDLNMKVVTYQLPCNRAYQDCYSKLINTYHKSELQLILQNLGLWLARGNNKFIPQIYKTSSRQDRLEILAGLLDTDGHLKIDGGGYDYVSKSKQLSEDVVFVARSLGFAAYLSETKKYAQNGTGGIYYRVSISGNMTELPLTLEYKKSKPCLQKKDVLVTGFKTEILPEDDFYGFELDGDHLYLDGNFTVHHNTGRGKEVISSGINRLLNIVKQQVPTVTEFIGPDEIASGPALYKYLSTNPCFVSVLSEFGLRIMQMADAEGSSPSTSLRRMFLQFYAKSGFTDVANPSIYSDKDRNIPPIQSPAFSIVGESTPHTFYNNLSEEMISEGLLPRFLIIEYDGDRVPRNKNHAEAQPSFALVEKLVAIAANAKTVMSSSPRRVIKCNFTSEAEKLADEFDIKCDRVMNDKGNNEAIIELWNRAHLKVLKLAALVAIGVNMFDPIIEVDHVKWAIDLVKNDIETLSKRFDSGHIGSNTDEIKQIELLLKMTSKYIMEDFETIQKYLDKNERSKILHENKVVPYSFLSRRLLSQAAFKNDRRGATEALKRCLQVLCDRDSFREVSKHEMGQRFGSTQKAYAVSDANVLK